MRRHKLVGACSPFVLLLLVASLHGADAFFGEWGPDLEGPWCAKRPFGEQCCDGRLDSCAVPILGTECYCYVFCYETAYDCCPDYWPHCHGFRYQFTTTPRPTTPPTPRPTRRCTAPDGRRYTAGQTYTDNCNTCSCVGYNGRSEWTCTDDVCLIRPEAIRMVNDGPFTWRARNYSDFWGMTLRDGIRYRLGTYPLIPEAANMNPISQAEAPIPRSFDARVQWPGWLDNIRDQENCGSSWAHSTVGVASDRLGIDSLGTIKEKLSAQHLISCNTERQEGCDGGHVDTAWHYILKQGLVSEECYPYTSGLNDRAGPCLLSANQSVGFCPSGIQYNSDMRFHVSPPYKVKSTEEEIQLEIQLNGPVQAIMQVREDFYMYSGGIYSYTGLPSPSYDREDDYRLSGYHSVKILGWGSERTRDGETIKYWLCANSWGPQWGENGYFRILRGANESMIETNIIGVWTRVNGNPELAEELQRNRELRVAESRRVAAAAARRSRGRFRSLPIRGRRGKKYRRRNRGGKTKKDKKANKQKLSRQERRERRRERRRLRRLRRKQMKERNKKV